MLEIENINYDDKKEYNIIWNDKISNMEMNFIFLN